MLQADSPIGARKETIPSLALVPYRVNPQKIVAVACKDRCRRVRNSNTIICTPARHIGMNSGDQSVLAREAFHKTTDGGSGSGKGTWRHGQAVRSDADASVYGKCV